MRFSDLLSSSSKAPLAQRPTSRFFSLGLTAALLLVSAVGAKPREASQTNLTPTTTRLDGPPKVDSTRVHRLYLDGEFDAAIAILEENLKETRQYRHEDSVFIFKHLGVMYAAQYHTREKGKYYMNRLLIVEPGARIMDMYASDMIYMIFKNIQEEYEQSRAGMGAPRHNAAPSYASGNSKGNSGGNGLGHQGPGTTTQSSGTKKWIWTGVAVGMIAAGVGTYIVLSSDQPAATQKEVHF